MAKYEEVMLSLRQGKYAPVYMLCGEEPYYIDKVCDWIETHVLDEMAREFDGQWSMAKTLRRVLRPI